MWCSPHGICRGASARSRTEPASFGGSSPHSGGTEASVRGVPSGSRTRVAGLRTRRPWPLDDGDGVQTRRARRGSNPRARTCKPRSSSENWLGERAAGVEPAWTAWKAAVLPLDDARETRRDETRRDETRRSGPRGNRTPSPSVGSSAGHHDSETLVFSAKGSETACAERLVRESNPSHSVDSGVATPVASRGQREHASEPHARGMNAQLGAECPRAESNRCPSSERRRSWPG